VTTSGLYQATTRRGRQRDLGITPHRFRHHLTHARLDNGGAEGDLTEPNGWASPRCPAAMAPAHKTPAHAATTTSRTTPAATDSDDWALMYSTATTPNADYERRYEGSQAISSASAYASSAMPRGPGLPHAPPPWRNPAITANRSPGPPARRAKAMITCRKWGENNGNYT
jgi:hypothetical protein